MRTAIRTSLILSAIFTGILVIGASAGELSRGAILSASCEGCHGPAGHSPGAIPDISGKSAEYIRTTLEEFRSGARPSTIMGKHVKGYTEEEVKLIAEFFAKQD